ncbi:hypothetical protein PHYSODRAFT_468362 [Phytophthora sojae]|uniref:Uncharacterized protein n=1 Tax=Phytophthora sojae (strain P6497) TaxID=1094619 RepID=G4YPR0_PHYSP|nr:hypothetical protein PHYSODRAFT_468362 [Phytophthora sojae]EGZ28657.1 hypothetical protein PHYSODRAFT_468362 [Phytophthora sojae]|eukprot:XP_009515932.1 hypothetical protein PHYSODRAFT_468362 [Phytophthora sojae]
MFPALASDSSLLLVLKLCLASLVFRSDFLLSQLPGTSIFRSKDLREQLRSRLVQVDSPWMTATGIPPQVVMFGLQEEIRVTVCALPESMAARFAQLLEENGICGGGVTQQQLEATLRRVMGENNQTQQQNAASRPGGDAPRTTVYFWPSDGKLHTLPESFEFPSTDVLHAWHLW